MSMNVGTVPYSYGDLLSISHDGPRTTLWFLSRDGVIRGVPLDTTNPAAPVMGPDEIVIRRGGATDSTNRAVLVKGPSTPAKS